jgi:hypothetical protein
MLDGHDILPTAEVRICRQHIFLDRSIVITYKLKKVVALISDKFNNYQLDNIQSEVSNDTKRSSNILHISDNNHIHPQ